MREGRLLVVVVALAVAIHGCKKAEDAVVTEVTPAPGPVATSPHAAAMPVLRLIVSGLVSVVPSDETETPDHLWLLVGNASDPKQLPIKVPYMQAHSNRLWVPKSALDRSAWDPEGDPVWTAGKPCQARTPPQVGDAPRPPEVDYVGVELRDEHLELAGRPGELTVERGNRLTPVVQGIAEARNFLWTASIDEALRNTPELLQDKTPNPDLQLAKAFFAENYTREGYPLISARLKIRRGNVFAERLNEHHKQREIMAFAFKGSNRTIQIAETVAIDIPMNGDVTIGRWKLSASNETLPAFVLHPPGPGRTLTVFLENENGSCGTVAEKGEKDFLFNHNLLGNPDAIKPANFPTPLLLMHDPGPTPHGQCSPIKAVLPGGGS